MFLIPAKTALLLLLPLSLLGKVAASASPPEPSPRASVVSAERLLASEGFETRIVETNRSPGIVVEANRGGCRIIAGDYPVHETFKDVYTQLAAPAGELSFAYRGRLYTRQPKIRSLADYYFWPELKRIGVENRRAPVIAVIASRGCALETVPWEESALVEA